MSQQKQNLMWLMIVCCSLCQISCSTVMIVGDNLTNICFWESQKQNCPAIKLIGPSACDKEINDFCTMNVKINTSSLGHYEKGGNKFSFIIKNKGGNNYEVRMNETDKSSIELWFLPDETKCLLVEKVTGNLKKYVCHSTNNCNSNGNPQGCLKIPSVDPKDACKTAPYDDNICKENEGNKYNLRLNANKWMCVFCENRPIFSVTTNGSIGLSKASEILNDLKTKMKEMEKSNASKAVIVMGDVIGLLQIQDKNTETKDICYLSDGDIIKVADCQTDLKAGFPWSVTISSEACNKSRLENNGRALVGILPFKNMGNRNETKIVLNNVVYGITMGANISNLTNNIKMLFTHNDKVSEASCVSWDGKGDLNWTTYGCETEINDNTIKCSCSHLTFFAVLMIPQTDANETLPHLESLTLITSIGCGISMFFLSIALFMHFLLRKAKSNQATKILMNMFVSLCLLNAAFLSNESVANTQDNTACVFIALVLHYSMLASFTWFFIQALHMYLWLIRQNVTITNYMRKITVLGWVFPTPIVIAIASVGEYKTLILKTSSEKISRMCWITNPYIHYIVNIGYYALVFIFTTGIFIIIVTKVVQARIIRATDGKRKTFRKQLMMVLSLFLLFGLTWSVMFFSYGAMIIPSYYIFTVLNSFQGFFLFLYYYHIHNGVAGHFSDDPENTDSNTIISQSSINAVYENIHN
ncbi:adhesion G-protein coupled receptor G1 isoform X3 [Labeo rohita]|uniref:adhesion G-protein coupled receptor G1 isoform X2 n=1 Tax=Labeo rohita TaxID=84645 RepID=UPI0021E299CE|nr:adhesion G-protein coupled receptor G1 isoform X2 [Labeo rohita]XP_050989324.1 adhesion G-protein coupled receptor G1 isoform X3 [Labeo rohita]